MDYNNTMCIDAQLGNLHNVRRSLERVRTTAVAHFRDDVHAGLVMPRAGALHPQHSTRCVESMHPVGRTMDNACGSRTSVQRSCGHDPGASHAVRVSRGGGRLSISRRAWTRARVTEGSACGMSSGRMDVCIASRRSTSGPPVVGPRSHVQVHPSRRVRHDPCRFVHMHGSKSRTEALGWSAGQVTHQVSLCVVERKPTVPAPSAPCRLAGAQAQVQGKGVSGMYANGVSAYVDRSEGEGWRVWATRHRGARRCTRVTRTSQTARR